MWREYSTAFWNQRLQLILIFQKRQPLQRPKTAVWLASFHPLVFFNHFRQFQSKKPRYGIKTESHIFHSCYSNLQSIIESTSTLFFVCTFSYVLWGFTWNNKSSLQTEDLGRIYKNHYSLIILIIIIIIILKICFTWIHHYIGIITTCSHQCSYILLFGNNQE